MSDSPLMNVGDIAKPIDTLIKKISKGAGILYEPRRIRNVAKAEAEAAMIKAESEIEVTDLHQRAVQRRLEEDAKQQKNIEDIITETEPHLNKDANPDAMDDDWIANFFDKCRLVSHREMQSLWSRILAGEANAPGTYSKRTVNFVSALDKKDANLFTKLCGFGWIIESFVPLIFDTRAEIYNKHGINFETLKHLDSIALINFQDVMGLTWEFSLDRSVRCDVSYYDTSLSLEIPEYIDNKIEVGMVYLTKIGQELAPICGSKPVDGFYEYVKDQWKQYLPTVEKD